MPNRRLFMISALAISSIACGVAAAAPDGTTRSDSWLRALVAKENEPREFGPFKWLDEGAAYTTVEDSPTIKDAKEIIRYTTASGARQVIVAAEQLIPANASSPLAIDDYDWSTDKTQLLLYTNEQKVWRQKTRGDYWVLDLHTRELRKLGGQSQPATLMFASFSPDGRRVAWLRRDFGPTQMATNLYVEDLKTGEITQLTRDAEARRADGTGKTIINGTADWVNEEEFDLRKAYEWSPDGRSIAYWQFDATVVRDFFLTNNTDTLYPVVTGIPYPKTGTENSSARVGVVSAAGGATRWLTLSDAPVNHYIPRLAWSEDNRELFIHQFDRPQQNLELLAVDVASGNVRPVVREHSDAWIDVVNDFKWLNDGREFLWVSERDGWRHVYVLPRHGGSPTLVTACACDVTRVAGLDEKGGWLYFIASPDDAARRYLYRARLRGGRVERITPEDSPGMHSYDVSPNGRWAVHTESRMEVPPVTRLVDLPAHRVKRALIDNEPLRLKFEPLLARPAEFFEVTIPGGHVLDGWMLKPPAFDPARKYPVLVFVYGEPAGQTVLDQWGDEGTLFHRYIAGQGYIVLSMDNRGTPAPKGSAWRHAIYGAIGVLAADEQAAALRALAAGRSYLDLDRIAVWGWSGGGSMTLHLMFRYPELYKVGMSVAAVPDQRYYDTIYQERYMGTPQGNPDGYKSGSPITYAEGLAGKLLIVGGTGDDNVHYQITEILINRLVALGKPFDLMTYPNRSHAIDEGEGTKFHLYSTLARHLTDHLQSGAR